MPSPADPSSTGSLRVGVVGCGRHAMTAIHPNLTAAGMVVGAVCTRSTETARAAAARHGGVPAFVDPVAMLDTVALDGIVVVVPPSQYGAVLSAAIARRVPVFADKPGAATAEEATDLAAAAAEAEVPVVIGYQKRFAPAYRQAAEIVRAEDFGVVTMATFTWAVGAMPLDLDSWLAENPVHHLDLARFLLGELGEVVVVRGTAGQGHSLVVAARTAAGAPVALHLTTTGSWQQRNEVVEIFGEGHAVVVDNVDTCTWRPPERPERVWRPNYTVPLAHNLTAATMGFAGELAHFRALVLGEVEPVSNLASAAATLRLAGRVAAGVA